MKPTLQEPLYQQGLIVDLYELTMALGYFSNRYNHNATFEVFVREMPKNRSYLVTAGLQQIIEYLLNLKFHPDQIAYLKQLSDFRQVDSEFWDFLAEFRFSGDMWAIPEGQIVFPGEPLVRISAPIIQAQVIETFLLSMINFQTLIASKAARVVQAATLNGRQRGVMEFGSRRAHGPEASILAARASYIAGCVGSSNVMAGMRFGIPVYGTAAHSWTMAFGKELDAFRAYHKVFPQSTILLIDTYDIEQGARNAVKIGPALKGVRIDSGDLLQESRKVRKILDAADMQHVKIIVSGDLNEYKIKRLVEQGAPIDSFGVGTQMVTSEDAASLGGIYKLVEQEIDGEIRYRAKFSRNKATYPGKKQVFRLLNKDGTFRRDVIGLENDQVSEPHIPLLQPVIERGELIYHIPELPNVREYFMQNFRALDEKYKQFEEPATYPVSYSEPLQKLFDQLKQQEVER